ncbi:GNAT family N-acetyltransferase [Streptomyces polyrhachis]|uniref:Lysine N-acyltransferase MbtK n=1 Tax=Streptomyces polyrhachis TaxID=1282885 RepID=A0ABW2GFB8_9ACTN
MQGQPPHPAARTGRTRRPRRHPVGVRHHPQPPERRPAVNDDTLILRSPFAAPTAPERAHPVTGWAAARTPAGRFRLEPVNARRDLPLLHEWMNDPAVDAFWELAGPVSRLAAHLAQQATAGAGSCLGLLDGRPMSYWEVYRADLDPLAAHYAARPHDTGVHLLIGAETDRGRGLGPVLLRAVAELVFDHRPLCERVVAEPDIRNAASVAAFRTAGFHFHGELTLPTKRAALMVRERSTRPW